MDNIQFRVLDERLKNIENLLKNLQPKPKKVRQSKIETNETLTFAELIKRYENKYSPMMIKDFLLYWEEGDRYRKEPVFDVEKRLERWKRQQEKWDYERSQKQSLKSVDERPIHRENFDVRQDTGFNSMGSLLSKYK